MLSSWWYLISWKNLVPLIRHLLQRLASLAASSGSPKVNDVGIVRVERWFDFFFFLIIHKDDCSQFIFTSIVVGNENQVNWGYPCLAVLTLGALTNVELRAIFNVNIPATPLNWRGNVKVGVKAELKQKSRPPQRQNDTSNLTKEKIYK